MKGRKEGELEYGKVGGDRVGRWESRRAEKTECFICTCDFCPKLNLGVSVGVGSIKMTHSIFSSNP